MSKLFFLSLSLVCVTAFADQIAKPYSPYETYAGPIYSSGYQPITDFKTEGDPCLNPMAQREWGNDCVCERQKAKVDWVKAEAKPLNDFNWNEIRSKQLVLIGDEHTQLNQDAVLNLMARSRSTSGKQCVFFEFSSDYTKDRFIELLDEKHENPQTNMYRRYFSKIVKGADQLGFNIYNVDHPDNYSASYFKPTEEERESHMIAMVRKLFDDKKCDHGIFLIGKNHIAKQLYLQDNMVERLSKEGFTLARLNPMMAQEPPAQSMIAGGWNNLCETQKLTPKEALIFSNSGIAKDFLFPGIAFPETTMKYGSFDYTVLLPDPWFDKFSDN